MPKDKASFKSKFPEWIKKLPRDEQGNFDKTGDELVFCKVNLPFLNNYINTNNQINQQMSKL